MYSESRIAELESRVAALDCAVSRTIELPARDEGPPVVDGYRVGPDGAMIFIDGSGLPRLSAQLNGGNPETLYTGERGEPRLDLSLDEENSLSVATVGLFGNPRPLAMARGQCEGFVLTKLTARLQQ
jgi:hypothetical protein